MSVELLSGDCLDVLGTLPADSIDACVTDPPYHLQSIQKRFANSPRSETTERYAVGAYGRHAKGFMGKMWDGGDIAFRPETWAAVLRVLKPGAHLIALCGTRTEHRVACAIEDAGFEIRDRVLWLYGSGFPKSHNLDGEWEGWGTALKPGAEIGVLARKPLSEGTVAANVARWGTGALNIDACRVEGPKPHVSNVPFQKWREMEDREDRQAPEQSYDASQGRWPANVVHDGSDEVLAGFPETTSGSRAEGVRTGIGFGSSARGDGGPAIEGSSGSAARFFYCAKAGKKDRADSKHPTVKPIALMRWLARMVTPPGGTVLDPFAGSGTTGQAAQEEGFSAILIEREAEYIADIRRRLGILPTMEELFS